MPDLHTVLPRSAKISASMPGAPNYPNFRLGDETLIASHRLINIDDAGQLCFPIFEHAGNEYLCRECLVSSFAIMVCGGDLSLSGGKLSKCLLLGIILTARSPPHTRLPTPIEN